MVVFLSYRFLYQSSIPDCLYDLGHVLTNFINIELNTNHNFYNWWIIAGQEAI